MNEIENDEKLNSYFSSLQWLFFWGVVLIGLLLRWYQLDARALHHDESLHVMYGKYIYDNPAWGYYKYDPMLHGPLLYSVIYFFYTTFGVSVHSARMPIVLIGTLMVFLPLVFRRYFSKQAVLFLTSAIALSPTLIYWSRFVREDYITILGFIAILYGALASSRSLRAIWIGAGVAIQATSKENWYVHIAMLLGYLVFEVMIQSFTKDSKITNISSRIWNYIKENKISTFLAILLASFIFIFFYSAYFQYSQGTLDGLYRKSIAYWWGQHHEERIKGPFLFHVYMHGWYETLFSILALSTVYYFYKFSNKIYLSIFSTTFIVALIVYLKHKGLNEGEIDALKFFHFFKAKHPVDIFGMLLIPVHAVLVTFRHIVNGEQKLALTGYSFWGALFTYSFLGEKVPWLSLYSLIAGLIYVTTFFEQYLAKDLIKSLKEYNLGDLFFRIGITILIFWTIFCMQEVNPREYTSFFTFIYSLRLMYSYLLFTGLFFIICGLSDSYLKFFPRVNILTGLVAFALLFNFRSAVLTNFTRAGESSEFISQVHTIDELVRVADRIRNENLSVADGYRPIVYVDGDGVWPLSWYFRDLTGFKFQNNITPEEKEKAKYQFVNFVANKPAPDGYHQETLKLRGWWVPDYNQFTLKNFIVYALTHKPWSGTGYSYIFLLTKKDS